MADDPKGIVNGVLWLWKHGGPLNRFDGVVWSPKGVHLVGVSSSK